MLIYDYKMSSASIVPAFIRQLELCKLQTTETVIFLSDSSSPREVLDAGLTACAIKGAAAYEVRVVSGTDMQYIGANPLEAPGLIEAFKQADLVVSFVAGFFSPWERAVREAGGRILNVLDVPQMLLTLQGTARLKEVALATLEQIRNCKMIHVTSDAGTDFSYDVDHTGPYLCHYGAADEPGRMDQWGQGMMATFPVDGSARGRVCVQPGDMWALPFGRLVRTPIELTIEEGYVVDIQGGHDATLFRNWLTECKTDASDMNPFAVSHLGWGLNPAASYQEVVTYDGRSDHWNAAVRALPGSFLFSTGPSHKRKTRGHIDMPLMGCSVAIDDRLVIQQGRLIDSDMIV